MKTAHTGDLVSVGDGILPSSIPTRPSWLPKNKSFREGVRTVFAADPKVSVTYDLTRWCACTLFATAFVVIPLVDLLYKRFVH
jgi:hypothetical protein